MSLQPHFTTQVQQEIEQIWSVTEKRLDVRMKEIQAFLNLRKIYCVWIRWPHWYTRYSDSDPVIYIPAKIVDIDYKSKQTGQDVPCMRLEHEFLEAEKGSPYILKAELHQCHFIKEHNWTSDALRPYRERAKGDILARFKRLESSYGRDWDVMKAIASELHKEQAVMQRAMATPPPSQSQPSLATTSASIATPATPTPTNSAQSTQATGASTLQTPASSSGSASSSNRLKRSLQDADGTSDEEDRSPTKRPNSSARRQAPLLVKQEDHQASPEPPAPVADAARPNEHVAKLDKAKEGITKANTYLAAIDTQAKALQEQMKIEIGEDSVSYLQTRGLIMQLQRFKTDLAELGVEIE